MEFPEVHVYLALQAGPEGEREGKAGGYAAHLVAGSHRKVFRGWGTNARGRDLGLEGFVTALDALKRPCTVLLHPCCPGADRFAEAITSPHCRQLLRGADPDLLQRACEHLKQHRVKLGRHTASQEEMEAVRKTARQTVLLAGSVVRFLAGESSCLEPVRPEQSKGTTRPLGWDELRRKWGKK